MIRIEEIEDEIGRLEQGRTSYEACQRLAVLYVVRDHLGKKSRLQSYSYSSSEFLQAVAQAPYDEVLQILDEHMDAVHLLYPKEYDMIISKIKST